MLQPFLLLPFPFYSFYHTPGFCVVAVSFCVTDFRAALIAVLRCVMASAMAARTASDGISSPASSKNIQIFFIKGVVEHEGTHIMTFSNQLLHEVAPDKTVCAGNKYLFTDRIDITSPCCYKIPFIFCPKGYISFLIIPSSETSSIPGRFSTLR